MPPKCKFTKEEIIQATFEMVRTEGFSELTARALGGRLGSSPKPIFQYLYQYGRGAGGSDWGSEEAVCRICGERT